MTQSTTNTIAALVTVLDDLLINASQTSRLARDAMQEENRNGAIGTLLPATEQLNAATAVHATIMTLHRR